MTEHKQSTLEEIIESERQLALTAEARYGNFYLHARECSIFLSRCILEVNHDRLMFARFFSLMKKHHMLALLSTVRLHKVQAMMNLRQVLESGAAAAFAIAKPELEHFAETDPQGMLDPSQDLTKKRYQWLDKNYADGSLAIKKKKELINQQSSHANVVSSEKIFDVSEAGDAVSAPFFDIEDEHHVRIDLWQISSIAIEIMDLLYGVNRDLNVIRFIPNFATYIGHVAKINDALLAEMKSTDRYKRAVEKMGSGHE